MNVLDLFSGIGGFSLGLERAGMETMAFCENDPFCRKVLTKHWPGVPIHDNIEELDGRQYRGTTQLVCGGFPCTPFSVAGNQRGAADDRFLWPEMFRVIREVEPAWVVGENVSGIINMELDQVLSDLEDSGYATQSFVVPACAVDAPHRRDRVWIIASHTNFSSKSDGSEYAGQSGQLDVADADPGFSNQQKEQIQAGRHTANSSGETVADTIGATGRGRGLHTDTSDKGREASRVRATRLQPEDGETQPDHVESGGKDVAHAPSSRQPGQGKHEHSSNQEAHREREASHALDVGFREERRSQPGVGGMVDGVSIWLDEPGGIPRVINGCPDRTPRLKALGNAVVPQVVEVLGRAILQTEANK